MSDSKKFVTVARGDQKADLVLKNCKIVDVFCESIIESDIAIVDGVIAGFGSYQGEEEIDVNGKYVIPGLIDGHVHIESSLLTPPKFAQLVVPRGTTTVVADPHEIGNVAGQKGIKYMIDASEGLPLDVRIMLPSCVPSTEFEQAGAVLGAKELEEMKSWNRVLGLGEMMNYPGVIQGNDSVHDKLSLFDGQIIDGHSPSLIGNALNAYCGVGVRTDHECSTVEEMKQRLSRGMYVLVREGSATKNLSTLVGAITSKNSDRVAFCTDDKQPKDILEDGHINYNVNKSIELGIAPISAIKMATLNSALCYRMYDRGAVAPGYLADLIVTDSIEKIDAKMVFKDGKIVAKGGQYLFENPKVISHSLSRSVHIQSVDDIDFALPLKNDIARVIRIIKHNITTEEAIRKVDVSEGEFEFHQALDILKIAVVERHHKTGSVGIGLLEGYGLKRGAIALSVAHDSHNIIVIGTNDQDMKFAVKSLETLGGGIVVVDQGILLGSLALEVGGLMTDSEATVVAKQLTDLTNIAHEMGVVTSVEPFMTLAFMALPVIPELKLTDKGLFDVRTFNFVDVNL